MKNVIIMIILINLSAMGREPISGSRFQQLSGTKQSQDTKTQWDQKYARSTFIYGKYGF